MLRKKRYYLLVLLPLLVALPLLLITSLQIAQAFLKASAVERLGSTHQETFVLPKGAVQWEEEGRELRINNRFFDASKVEENGNQLIITGHFDDAETAVWQVLEQTTKGASQVSLNQLLLLLQCLFFVAFIWIEAYQQLKNSTFKNKLSPRYQSPFLPLPFAPPRG